MGGRHQGTGISPVFQDLLEMAAQAVDQRIGDLVSQAPVPAGSVTVMVLFGQRFVERHKKHDHGAASRQQVFRKGMIRGCNSGQDPETVIHPGKGGQGFPPVIRNLLCSRIPLNIGFNNFSDFTRFYGLPHHSPTNWLMFHQRQRYDRKTVKYNVFF